MYVWKKINIEKNKNRIKFYEKVLNWWEIVLGENFVSEGKSGKVTIHWRVKNSIAPPNRNNGGDEIINMESCMKNNYEMIFINDFFVVDY